MLACVGIALAKWNFLSKKEQEILLDKVSFRGGYLKDVLTDYDKEKYSSKQNNENFPEITKEDVFRRWNSYKGAQLDTYNYEKYKIYKHKTNDKFSLYILADDYHGCDLEFAYFDKKII
ncbi:hypothetical protein [Spiroplasma endosymbiont of Agriotes lineatus]|uniref:hypothetical protein n=1 Tax=Spiroplasma endosymbiont of Agriotes lineatus TaxID=3077930 RepID=UPI0030CE2AED